MRNPGLVRFVLVALGGLQLLYGLLALLAPRSFYDDFPFGRGWVAAYPSYSEHLVRDVGSLFVATAVLLLFAAAWMTRPLLIAALTCWLIYTTPHTIFHFAEADALGTGDAVAELIALSATVLLPAWALVQVLKTSGTPAETRSGNTA